MKTISFQKGSFEGQNLGESIELSCDVCIVGSGPGGATAAKIFSEKGLSVILVEAGPYHQAERFRMHEHEGYSALYQDGGQRTSADGAIQIYQGACVGGGSTVNWTTCFRLPEATLNDWHENHGCKSLHQSDLEEPYTKVEERLGIQTTPESGVNANNAILREGAHTLGWEAARTKRNVRGCAQTSFCGLGCPVDAKQSMLVTHIPDALEHNTMLLSRVYAKAFSGSSRVEKLECIALDASGKPKNDIDVHIKAKNFIASAGAINTPALLLRSSILKNCRGARHIGRRTFLHPVVLSAALMRTRVEGFRGAPQSIASHAHITHGSEESPAFFLEAAPVHPALAASALPGIDLNHRRAMERLPYIAGHIALMADGFYGDEGGHITLDSSGRPKLHYPMSSWLRHGFLKGHKALAQLQFAAGARALLSTHTNMGWQRDALRINALEVEDYRPNSFFCASAHQMGGCAFGSDPARSVVNDEDARVYGIDNLQVIDGSLFPTSLGVNPQLSIYALATHYASRTL